MDQIVDNSRKASAAARTIPLNGDTQFTIKHLAGFSGIKPHTIRMWEQRFFFQNPQRTEASRRVYTSEQIISFLEFCLLKQNGYKMERIAQMSREERRKIIAGINGPQMYARAVYELMESMLMTDITGFNNRLNEYVATWGIHQTIQYVVIPFSERVGLFQNPEKKNYRQQLYLIMECIKQKIYLAIENAVSIAEEQKLTVLLFIPGSTAELPLLYLHYLVRREGYSTIYLGNYFSFPELDTICKKEKPHYIMTHLPSNYRDNEIGKFIECLPDLLPGSRFISAGRSVSVNKNLHYRHANTFNDIIASLRSF
jgi:MerR family transcriptional regulator, light-induced transcriptional regulator